jgi:hypothetical protein
VFTTVVNVTLPYAPDVVFLALASVEGTVRWQSGVRGVSRARPAPGPLPAADARTAADPAGEVAPPLVLHYWALGARHRLRARVTAHQPPERFAYRAEGAGFALDVTFVVAPARPGCEVTCTAVLRDPDAGALPFAAPTKLARTGPALDATLAARGSDLVRLRRLLARRLPRDLVRLEAWVAVQPGARRRSSQVCA